MLEMGNNACDSCGVKITRYAVNCRKCAMYVLDRTVGTTGVVVGGQYYYSQCGGCRKLIRNRGQDFCQKCKVYGPAITRICPTCGVSISNQGTHCVKHVPRTKQWRMRISEAVSKARVGMKLSESHRKNIGLAQTGVRHWAWKGKDVGYHALHAWIKRVKGTPSYCDFCGTDAVRRYEWGNVSGEYLRDEDDYVPLCVPCHRTWDFYIYGLCWKQ